MYSISAIYLLYRLLGKVYISIASLPIVPNSSLIRRNDYDNHFHLMLTFEVVLCLQVVNLRVRVRAL